MVISHLTLRQIIKEKLPFPSGTATAQLIGVMYRTPVHPEGLRNRRGYQALDQSHLPDDIEELTEEDSPAQDREVLENTGWKTLTWSIAASAFVTVGPSYVINTPTSAHLIISFSPIFSPLYLLSRSLGCISQRNGYGGSHRVSHMSAKVRGCQRLGAVAKYARRSYHGFSHSTLHEPG